MKGFIIIMALFALGIFTHLFLKRRKKIKKQRKELLYKAEETADKAKGELFKY